MVWRNKPDAEVAWQRMGATPDTDVSWHRTGSTPDTDVAWQRTGSTPDPEGSWQRTGTEVPWVRLEPPVPAMRGFSRRRPCTRTRGAHPSVLPHGSPLAERRACRGVVSAVSSAGLLQAAARQVDEPGLDGRLGPAMG